MARQIHEREDLLRDAVALRPRAVLELQIAGRAVDVFAGFRGESLSLYFGDDPAFHFNAAGELRRAYVGNCLIKAERGRLVSLERRPLADAVALVRHELDDAAARDLLNDLTLRVTELSAALAAGKYALKGQEPPDGDSVKRLDAWLADRASVAIAASPRVG